MDKDDLIIQQQLEEIDEERQFDEMVECQIEDMKIKQHENKFMKKLSLLIMKDENLKALKLIEKHEENLVLLHNLLTQFTDEQIDILSCLVENAIESNVDYLNDVDEKEKPYWKGYVLKLKDIQAIIKPLNMN